MVRQRTVLTALSYFSIVVFVSIWLMTRNFPEKKCDCSNCVKELKLTVESRAKSRRNTQEEDETELKFPTKTFTPEPSFQATKIVTKGPSSEKPVHKLGVIVPYRDRFEELLEFVPHMSKFFREQNISYHIYVINQVDEHRFNRASLINVGFLIASNESCDYIAMHDVDLLPINKELKYAYPERGPFHVSAPNLHPKYHYPKFIGGIMLMTKEQFKKVNGLSTKFWGWGREDDELYMRIADAKISIFRPVGITTGHQNTFKHNHSKKRKRDYPKTRTQYKESLKRDHESGLDTMNHKISSRHEMTIGGDSLTMIAVQLPCNHTITPWCD